MRPYKDHLDGLSVTLLLIACASWGLQQVAVKLAAADISPVMQSAIRSFGAGAIVALWMGFRQQKIFIKDGTLWWGVGAGLLFGGEFLLIYWGLEFTNASRAVIFLYMSPFVVAIGSQIFVPSEKLTRLQYVGLTLSFIGIAVAFGESFTLPSPKMLIGDAMLIGAAVLWGATTVLIKASPLTQIAPVRILLYQLAVSAPLLLAGSLILQEPGIINLSPIALGSLAYQTLWIAAITYAMWFWLISHYPAPKLASFSFLTPFFGVLAGGIILNEPITTALITAMILVGAGIYLVNRKTKA